MQQAPPEEVDASRRSKLMALLDRARTNRGLQPDDSTDMLQDETKDVKIKLEPPSHSTAPFPTLSSPLPSHSTTPFPTLSSPPPCDCSDNKVSIMQQMKPIDKPSHDTTQEEAEHDQLSLSSLDNAISTENDEELTSDFQHVLHMLIPSNATAALLERRGQPIQRICEQSDCLLSIREPAASPFPDDRVLRLSGRIESISLAQQLVITRIRAFRAEKGDLTYCELLEDTLPVALPATSINKAVSAAVMSKRELSSPFTWLVERERMGKIMGRHGTILTRIRRETGAQIHVDDDVIPGTNERRMILAGDLDAIQAALDEITSRVGGREAVTRARVGHYCVIPRHAAGHLIGRKGSTIQSITDRTGARVQLPPMEDLPLGSINRIVHLQGTAKQVEHARKIIAAKLRDYLASSSVPQGDRVSIKVLLPLRICGLMLDQRGLVVHEITEKSGAHMYFLAPHGEETRVCVITGEIECVLSAQQLILKLIASDAVSKQGNASRKRKRVQREEVAAGKDESFTDDHVDTKECHEIGINCCNCSLERVQCNASKAQESDGVHCQVHEFELEETASFRGRKVQMIKVKTASSRRRANSSGNAMKMTRRNDRFKRSRSHEMNGL